MFKSITTLLTLLMTSSLTSSIYDIPLVDIDGKTTTLSSYKNKVLLIVNVASKCGFTRQYSGLEELHQTYHSKGLVVLGFPCNQFGSQEPGSDDDIKQFCELNYGVSFPISAKIDVNGPDEDPLFTYLKNEARGVLGSKAIKWNFTKFVVDRDGKVRGRYAPVTKPDALQKIIDPIIRE